MRIHDAVLTTLRDQLGNGSGPGSREFRPDASRMTTVSPVRYTGYGTHRARNVDATRIPALRRQHPNSGSRRKAV